MKIKTPVVLLLCVFALQITCRADVTDTERIDYVKKVWGVVSDGDDSAQFFTDKLNLQYNGSPNKFKDYVSAFISAGKLSVQLDHKDYYGAARTAADFAADSALTAIFQELEVAGEVGVVSFSVGMIDFSLNYFVKTVGQTTFNEQCRFYFVAREQLGMSAHDILNHPNNRDDILFDDSGWIYTLPDQGLSWRAGHPFFASPADFFAVAEKLYSQHTNQLALEADSQQIGEAFRQVVQPVGPQFTTNLNNQTITEGQTIMFAVAVSGTGPFQYVWSVNGSALAGPYGSSLNATEAGTYQVTVYDANQRLARSRVATLTVNPPSAPVTIGSPVAGAFLNGTYTVRASAPSASKVEFWLDGVRRYTDPAAPFTWNWDTTVDGDGSHQLIAKAYSGTNLLGSTPARTVTVDNTSSGNCADANEPNNSSLTGTWLPLGTSLNSYICTASDVDWFRIPVTMAGVITISLTVPAGQDFDLEFYGADGTWKAGSYQGAGKAENISFNAVTPGIYYARVYGFPAGNGSHSTSVAYTISATPANMEDGLVAYYPFNGNASDASGNGFDGVEQNVTATADRFGNANSALLFNGSSSDVEVTNIFPMLNEQTVAVWVNPATLNGYQPIIDKAIPGFGGEVDFQLRLPNNGNPNDGTVNWVVNTEYGATGTFAGAIGHTILPVGQWSFVACVTDQANNQVRLYVNGVLDATGSMGGRTVRNRNYPFRIGKQIGQQVNFSFNGSIDDVRIYNRALSAAEIQQIYSKESANPAEAELNSGLVADYPFNGNANDLSGNNNPGTVHNSTLTTDRFGVPNSAYDFNGSNGFIDVPQNTGFDLTTNFALSAWIYQRGTVSGGYRIFDKLDAVTPGFALDTYSCSGGSGHRLRLQGAAINPCNAPGSTDYALMAWHHVVATVSGNVGKVYLDGNLEGTGDVGNIPHSALDLFIGSAHLYGGAGNVEWFNGVIDDVRIYNRALSAPEVQQLYNTAEIAQVSGAITILSQPASHKSSVGDSTVFSVTTDSTNSVGYQWQHNGADIPGANATNYITPALTLADNGAIYLVRITNSTSSVFSTPAVLTITTPRIGTFSISTNGNFSFVVNTDDSRPHTIEVSTNLVNWSPVATNSAINGVINYSSAVTSGDRQRFYRAVVR